MFRRKSRLRVTTIVVAGDVLLLLLMLLYTKQNENHKQIAVVGNPLVSDGAAVHIQLNFLENCQKSPPFSLLSRLYSNGNCKDTYTKLYYLCSSHTVLEPPIS